jgi:hypothetical protein
MEKLDSVVAEHIEHRLLQPKRLEHILSRVLDRREERATRRTSYIAELRKRAVEAGVKLKRLYDAIENGIADVSDPMLRERVTELKTIMGSKSVLLRTLVAASSAKTAGFGVPSFVPNRRAGRDSNSSSVHASRTMFGATGVAPLFGSRTWAAISR